MKFKKILCAALVCAVMMSCITNVVAIQTDDTDGFVDIIRNVDTVDVAILLKAEADDRTRVSLRSKGIDVNAVASHFGGGGHIRASGCTINLPLEEAKQALIEVIK